MDTSVRAWREGEGDGGMDRRVEGGGREIEGGRWREGEGKDEGMDGRVEGVEGDIMHVSTST